MVALFPALSARVLRIVIVASAAGAALFVLRTQAARAWWTSPFNLIRHRPRPPASSTELDGIAAKFGGRRQIVPGGTPIPPETIRLLRPLTASAFRGPGESQAGPHPDLSPLTRALPELEPQVWPRWFQTRSADPRNVAHAVHRVMDDIDRLEAEPGHSVKTSERAPNP